MARLSEPDNEISVILADDSARTALDGRIVAERRSQITDSTEIAC
jgi:hypothetical protein